MTSRQKSRVSTDSWSRSKANWLYVQWRFLDTTVLGDIRVSQVTSCLGPWRSSYVSLGTDSKSLYLSLSLSLPPARSRCYPSSPSVLLSSYPPTNLYDESLAYLYPTSYTRLSSCASLWCGAYTRITSTAEGARTHAGNPSSFPGCILRYCARGTGNVFSQTRETVPVDAPAMPANTENMTRSHYKLALSLPLSAPYVIRLHHRTINPIDAAALAIAIAKLRIGRYGIFFTVHWLYFYELTCRKKFSECELKQEFFNY